jgi:hypothetical protein
MSIRRLFNHIVRVYREPDPLTARDSFGSVPLAPEPVGSAPTLPNARPDQNWGGSLDDFGAGEQQGSIRRWFLSYALDVRERDVLSVIAGPESPKLLRVLSVAPMSNRTSVHHLEANVEVWKGEVAA